MRKGIFFSLLCLIAVFAVACGGGNNAGDTGENGDGGENGCTSDNGDGNGGDSASDGDDHWNRYVSSFKEGRTWTYEMQGGMLSKNEVVSVTDEQAEVKSTTIMNGEPMGEPTTTPYPLTQTEGEGGEEGEAPQWEESEQTVKAGTFECVSMDGKTWMMKKYPVIIVKSEAMELVEFNE